MQDFELLEQPFDIRRRLIFGVVFYVILVELIVTSNRKGQFEIKSSIVVFLVHIFFLNIVIIFFLTMGDEFFKKVVNYTSSSSTIGRIRNIRSGGTTPLIESVAMGHTKYAELLLSSKKRNKKIDVNTTDADGNTALMWAAFVNNIDILKILLIRGAKTKIANKRGLTPHIVAAELGHIEIVKILIQREANIHRRTKRIKSKGK